MTPALSTFVEERHVVEPQYLTTSFVVFPVYEMQEFLARYERIADFAVRRSVNKVTFDSEHALFAVVMFKNSVEEFKTTAVTVGAPRLTSPWIWKPSWN